MKARASANTRSFSQSSVITWEDRRSVTSRLPQSGGQNEREHEAQLPYRSKLRLRQENPAGLPKGGKQRRIADPRSEKPEPRQTRNDRDREIDREQERQLGARSHQKGGGVAAKRRLRHEDAGVYR